MLVLYLILLSYLKVEVLSERPLLWNSDWQTIRREYQNYTWEIMDTNADPCDNFKQYTCGKWLSFVNISNETQPDYSSMHLVEDEIHERLNETFADKTFFENYRNDDIITKAKKFYDSCMNVEAIKQRGMSPLIELLDSFGGVPALKQNWNEPADWEWLIAELRLLGNEYLLSSPVYVDLKNSSDTIVDVAQPSLEYNDRREYEKPELLTRYKDKLHNIIIELGGNTTTASYISHQILDFEIKLANISKSVDERDYITDKVNIKELSDLYPLINWYTYFDTLFNNSMKANQIIQVETTYVNNLIKILNVTDKTTIFNYALLRFAISKKNMTLSAHCLVPKDWWKKCVNRIIKEMDLAAGHIFARKYLKAQKRDDVQIIAEKIKEKFRSILKTNSWMDAETKEKAIHKLDAMSVHIGLAEFMNKRSGRKSIFENIQIAQDRFFENAIKLLRGNSRIELKHLLLIKSSLGIATVNAHYDLTRNKASITAGILQLPLYHPSFPQYKKFGIVGYIIAHEIAHGFDFGAIQHGSDGTLGNVWFSNYSLAEYEDRILCLMLQYNQFNIDGITTLVENIAENVGLKVAFLAYKDWLAENQNSSKIDLEKIENINLSSEHLFFISASQRICEQDSIRTPSANPNSLHPSEIVRVRGVLSNSREFSEHFGCKVGAKLNPIHKCELF